MQKIIPAILASDPADLKEKLGMLKGHTNWLHIDIMDGKFVQNVSVNLFELGEAYQFFNLEIHLMVQDPLYYFEDCDAVGAKRVIFHWDAAKDVENVLEESKKHHFHAGIALNPQIGPEVVGSVKTIVDSFLIMSVIPGAQGQEFIPQVLEKIPTVRKLFPRLLIGVDGGVNEGNISRVFAKGADYVAVGSGIFNTSNPLEALRKLEAMVKK